MSKFFQDVGDVISLPVKTIFNAVTNNPKGNSIGDIWNNTVGPGNPYQELASDVPGAGSIKKLTGADLAAPFEAPTWQDLGKPGQAFAQHIDQTNKILPSVFQPYAEPVEAIALSAFNPFAGAALQTAYQGGQEQQQQKGFDWGELGKNAAINFGTAGVADIAKNALTAADAANQARSTLSGFNAALPSASSGTSSALQATVDAARANTTGALSAFGSNVAPLAGSSVSAIPYAQGLQTSGKGIADSAYQASLRAATPLANGALTATLAPPDATPVAGALDNFNALSTNTTAPNQYGDVLNAFGGGEVNTANPTGPRISNDAFNQSVSRLAANDYLQQNQTRDTALPAGQYQPQQNTPYANRLSDINKSTTQAYSDLLDQTNNANRYYSIIDSNPGLTPDQLNAYLQDPSSGQLGNLTVSSDAASFLKDIKPLGPINSSLLNSSPSAAPVPTAPAPVPNALGGFNITSAIPNDGRSVPPTVLL